MEAHESRRRWKSKSEYLLACIGYAVGLGNIWRFPYLCYTSGGGAFLIPYFVMLVLCGIPLLYMELAVGQLTRLGPVHAIAKLCPLLKGTGLAMVLLSFYLCTYYNVIIAWALYYLFHSFSNPLPWTFCDNSWKTPFCVDGNDNNTELYGGSHETDTEGFHNITEMTYYDYGTTTTFPAEDYFKNVVLQQSDGLGAMGGMQWSLVGFLFLAWLICFFCLCKGVKSVGKVVYFTATFPYLLLLVLLIRALTLPGAKAGILYFLTPSFPALIDPQVWWLAAVQIFNSIGIAFGSLIAFASYNDKNNNITVDTLAIASINSFTSILAGFVVFATLGNISDILGVDVSDVVTAGPELVFVTIPTLFTKLPLPNLWAVLFFLMLICLGIDSQFATVEVINTSLVDQFGVRIKKIKLGKEIVVLIVCGVCFLLGLPYVSKDGIYFFHLVDNFAAVRSLMYVAYFEVMAICWFFGANRLAHQISFSSRVRPWYFFPFCWLWISPLLITGIISFNSGQPDDGLYYGNYTFPKWSLAIGNLIMVSSTICVPIGVIHTLVKARGSCKQRLGQSITPTFVPIYAKPPHLPQTAEQPTRDIELQPVQTTNPDISERPEPTAQPEECMTPPPDYKTVATVESEPLMP